MKESTKEQEFKIKHFQGIMCINLFLLSKSGFSRIVGNILQQILEFSPCKLEYVFGSTEVSVWQ